MRQLLRSIATFLGIISPLTYAYPAIDIQLANERQLHLVGSIHMGSQDMAPLPDALLQRLRQATALIVEADISDTISPFQYSDAEQPLIQRLSPENYRRLQKICVSLAYDISNIDTLPSWQAALMLQARQAQFLGLRPDNGIDYQLINAAKSFGVQIIELEGQQTQVDLLQQLPHGGLSLLEDTLKHWDINARLLQTMVGWWLDNKPGDYQPDIPATFSNEMADLLMGQRNRRWQQQLQTLPPGNYVVAVGALHLYGDENLPSLLRNAHPASQ
ncbi:TraB/GumN family protein [Pectobacterium cacticida]|uniref:TraB/GumN family protein n=1 Tax=Pectobacterium cacticida TaxID=69221 RepID=A0ABZ2G7Z5_9GAMM|nr:TraB/GumN family protein [Pectobacterium cacticida]UYX07717.1 TraB/GumN family protein [Pectobacterium cacticida]